MKRAGFSLLELLVVMAVIVLFTVGIGVSLTDGRVGYQLRSAEQVGMRMVRAARAEAILKQTRSRLLIKASGVGDEDGLRLMGIIYEDPDVSDRWYGVGKGRRLPRGVYYWPEKSTLSSGPMMRLNYPRKDAQFAGVGEEWYYLEFDRRGHLDTGSVRWVMGVASQKEDGGIGFYSETKTGGFYVFRLGAMGPLRGVEGL